MSAVHDRLAQAGYSLPTPAVPVAAYVPAARTGNLIFTAGQLPFVDGVLPRTGKVGTDLSADEAAELAAVSAINAIAALTTVLDDLDKVTRVVKVTGFIASDPSFTQHSVVMNAASEIFQIAFGDSGVHARSSVGMAVLPLDSPVEVEIIVEVAD